MEWIIGIVAFVLGAWFGIMVMALVVSRRGGVNDGWILERRVVRYSDLLVHRVYVYWPVVDD